MISWLVFTVLIIIIIIFFFLIGARGRSLHVQLLLLFFLQDHLVQGAAQLFLEVADAAENASYVAAGRGGETAALTAPVRQLPPHLALRHPNPNPNPSLATTLLPITSAL